MMKILSSWIGFGQEEEMDKKLNKEFKKYIKMIKKNNWDLDLKTLLKWSLSITKNHKQ